MTSQKPEDGIARLYTERRYPCGCTAQGSGDVPAYCAEHGVAPPSIAALLTACEPFVRCVENSAGRIPSEMLSGADWHSIAKAYRQHVKREHTLSRDCWCQPTVDSQP